MDGQTAIVCWPAWFFGGLAGVTALVIVFASREARPIWPVVLVAGLASAASIALAFKASANYELRPKSNIQSFVREGKSDVSP
jgi:hypothetical protein